MSKRRLEDTSYGLWFFLTSVAMLLITAWVVYNEVETRRPWKKYQREFFALEQKSLEQALADAEQKLSSAPLSGKLEKIDEQLSEAESKLASPEYEQASADALLAKRRHDDLQQSLSFIRSERDEAFYEWKQSVREDKESPRARQRYHDLEEEIRGQESKLKDRASKLAAAREALSSYTDLITTLTQKREKLTAERDLIRRRLEAVGSKRLAIDQVVVDDLDAVDRCATCHLAIDRQGFDGEQWKEPFRTHPDHEILLGKVHPVSKFGCVVCHRGQGPQLKGIGRRPFDHGRSDPHWEKPMFEAPFTESSCPTCHQDEWRLDGAPTLNHGKRLFTDLACYACHQTAGYENARRIGPSLADVSVKVTSAWLVAWLNDPKGMRPRTRMPDAWPPATFADGDAEMAEEIKAVAAFVTSVSSARRLPVIGAGDAERGRTLFVDRGCSGCHRPATLALPELTDAATLADVAPDLNFLGSKTNADWIGQYLTDPRATFVDARMPNPILDPTDRADLAAFLMSLKREPPPPEPGPLFKTELIVRGRELATAYGCYGCHELKGFERQLKTGPELDGFGDKTANLLSFGDTVTDHSQQTWDRWTRIKLVRPRAFRTEREPLVMTDNGLDAGEVEALMVFLKSLRAEKASPNYLRRLTEIEADAELGERLLQEYNCLGCHLEDEQGGEVRKVIGNPALVPPDLTGEGSKVAPAWLYQFLKKPVELRPWLSMRMPDFGLTDREAKAFVGYFMRGSEEAEVFVEVPVELAPELMAGAEAAFTELKCLSCHQLTLGGELKLSDLAPDLALTRSRLRPQWIYDFIVDPQWLMPETKMPSFFPLEDDEDPNSIMTPMTEWLDGDAMAQVKAIGDYLYVMAPGGAETVVEGGDTAE